MAIVSKDLNSLTATIASGQTVGAAVDLLGMYLVAFVTPAALTGATFTFQASADNATFAPLYAANGSAYSIPVGTSRYIQVPPPDFAGIRYLKFVSNLSEGADRSLTLLVRPI